MAEVRPFSCIRPEPGLAAKIATGPHSALKPDEIYRKIQDNPLSFSRIVHPKFLWGETEKAYRKAAETLEKWITEGVMIDDRKPGFYLYRLESGNHRQTGLVCTVPVDELYTGRLRLHERVREGKLLDIARHMGICRAQIGGPLLTVYRRREALSRWIEEAGSRPPLYHFRSENGLINTIWKISAPEEIAWIQEAMGEETTLYIADGHHRAMAEAWICRQMRQQRGTEGGSEP